MRWAVDSVPTEPHKPTTARHPFSWPGTLACATLLSVCLATTDHPHVAPLPHWLAPRSRWPSALTARGQLPQTISWASYLQISLSAAMTRSRTSALVPECDDMRQA